MRKHNNIMTPFVLNRNGTKPGLTRLIVELSPMINNQELALTLTVGQAEEFKKSFIGRAPFNYRLILERPIHISEPAYPAKLHLWEPEQYKILTPITKTLDAMVKISDFFEMWQGIGVNLTQSLIKYIEANYFDCMSGGLSTYECEVLRYFIENRPDIDINAVIGIENQTLKEWAAQFNKVNIDQLIRAETKL